MLKKSKYLLQKELQLLYLYTQEMILLFNKSGDIIDCNLMAKEELGYWKDIYHVYIATIFRKAMRKENNKLIINTKFLNQTVETVAYRRNQTCFSVTLRVALFPENNKFYGLCTALNIQSEKDALRKVSSLTEDLESSDQLKNQFITNITHELKTPVNGIIGLTNALLDSELKPKQVEAVNMINRSCLRMKTLINNVLDYTLLTNHKMILEQREFDFYQLIDKLVSINSSSINEKGLKLLVNVAEDIPIRVIGDEFRLMQVLNNLISNAVKFTSVGQITIEVVKISQQNQDLELFFMIADTGIGISPEEMDKLFKSFTQVDGSYTRQFEGVGIGLTISKMLIEAMQGNITVESEKGMGTTFSFSIHLSIPSEKNKDESRNLLKENTFNYDNEEFLGFPELDYISRILDEAKHNKTNAEKVHFFNLVENRKEKPEIREFLRDRLERLAICIEMEAWSKAENFATVIKKTLANEEQELYKKALSLVLTVRKEDHDRSLIILEELKDIIKEVF
ncbi:MAG: hypothetical protein GX306_09925 [Clostridiales bacterium]|nr:hypothetical protein [Clostridiales bacterium]